MINYQNNNNNSMTIEEQQYNQKHQQHNNEQYNHKDYQQSDYYNNNYISHAPARVLPPEAGERILEAYIDNVADRMTAAAARIIEDAYAAGMSVDEILMAIEDTGLAPRPSPAYLRAILAEWTLCGVTVSRASHKSMPCRAEKWWMYYRK